MKKITVVIFFCLLVLPFIYFIPRTNAASSSEVAQRVVLAELFTSTNCSHCPYSEEALEQLADEYGPEKLAVLEYHVSGELKNQESYDRVDYYYWKSPITGGYPGFGTPTVIFDGVIEDVGAHGDSTEECYKSYKTNIEPRVNLSSAFELALTSLIADTRGTLTVQIKALKSPEKSNLKVRFVIFEDNVYCPEGKYGGPYYRFVVRDILAEEPLVISVGELKTINRTFTVQTGWNREELGVVVFIQTDENAADEEVNDEVMQAAISKFGFSILSDETARDVSIGGTTIFNTTLRNTRASSDTVRLNLVKSLPTGWTAYFCVDDICYPETTDTAIVANGSKNVEVSIIVADNAPLGELGTVTLSAVSNTNSYLRSAVTLTAVAVSAPTPVVTEVGSVSKNSITLSWSRNTDTNFIRYEIHKSQVANFTPTNETLVVSITNQAQTSYEVKGLSPNTDYYFKIVIVNDYGSSESNEISARTLSYVKGEAAIPSTTWMIIIVIVAIPLVVVPIVVIKILRGAKK